MPFFDGTNIFGAAVKMQTVDNPRASQENAFPGLSGIESLDQGDRGRFTTVTGLLFGGDPPSQGAAEALFRSYKDGLVYLLTDAYGVSWPFVKLESFEPQGRVMPLLGVGWYRAYTARFRHLV
jgi:hypothetical protein